MPDYSQAKIYCIKSSQTSEVYYGSTCKSLAKRFTVHKSDYKTNITSKKILQYTDAYIELVEEFPCNNKQELCIRERFYIENNPCVNLRIPGRTRKENQTLYSNKNKEARKAYNKAYYETNKDNIRAYQEIYREANKN
jgi:hypothetical protein